jgi:hypothetical protein
MVAAALATNEAVLVRYVLPVPAVAVAVAAETCGQAGFSPMPQVP